ncbi:hypothetical protein DY000_02049787 [Brassica cretica]|uniref:Uncharacterized protein n=1 Tax=Brassica cretica TaxID=69181 RepID=A0ABQ7EP29_BRACR|nr:hypothetical protein DY000_02049787 [Brassica cretica]
MSSFEVSVPSVICSSADWDNKKTKKRNKKKKKGSYEEGSVRFLSESRDVDGCVAVPDVWCGPGLGQKLFGVVGAIVVVASLCCRWGPTKVMSIWGAPLSLIHVSSSDPLPHLSIKNIPIETSSAQFIRQWYTAASSGQKLQNSITNAYGEAQDDHF